MGLYSLGEERVHRGRSYFFKVELNPARLSKERALRDFREMLSSSESQSSNQTLISPYRSAQNLYLTAWLLREQLSVAAGIHVSEAPRAPWNPSLGQTGSKKSLQGDRLQSTTAFSMRQRLYVGFPTAGFHNPLSCWCIYADSRR